MKPLDSVKLACELRDTARDLRLCLAELIFEDGSLLADLLRYFPTRIEALADVLAKRPAPDFAPPWLAPEAPCEVHFATLLARQRWWLRQQKEGGRETPHAIAFDAFGTLIRYGVRLAPYRRLLHTSRANNTEHLPFLTRNVPSPHAVVSCTTTLNESAR